MRASVALLVLLALVTVGTLLRIGSGSDVPPVTSLDPGPLGYRAAYELLSSLVAVERSYVPLSEVPVDRTLWMMEPGFLSVPDANRDELLAWLERGGTAVVFGGGTAGMARLELPTARWHELSSETGAPDVLARERREAAARSIGASACVQC